ncbi:MAG: ATP-dependent zinc metalloprotease FtsH, partial [Chloroflexota bacterium]
SLEIEHKFGEENAISRKEPGVSFFDSMLNLGVSEASLAAIDVTVEADSPWDNWLTLGITILPFLFFGGLLFFMLRQAQGSNNQAMSFGRSKAKMFTGDKPTVMFDDVAGADEAKEELSEVVEFLKEPEKFISIGARIPKGVLMVGPPGCGKTLLAKAVSGEAGVPFFSISGSEFVEMFVGVGASRVRDLFEQAKRNSPCIIFVDEIDAVGRHRGAGLGGSHDEREQTLNQILVEMDGFDTDTNVIVIAATNRPDILDPALLRPGRFDRKVVLDRPDWVGRRKILDVHMRGKPIADSVDRDSVAKRTIGFVGADLENLVNESAILTARNNGKEITIAEIDDAIEKLVLGPERRSRVVPDKEKEVVAYHEAGHALIGQLLKDAHDPVQKVTIIPRGMAGGVTWYLPTDDLQFIDDVRLNARLAVALGGRVAEEVVFGDITTGASGDIQSVTGMARAMVTSFGMSEKLGRVTYGEKDELVFLGREISEQRNYSDETAEEIDQEVKRIVAEAHETATKLMIENRHYLDAIAQRLIDEETIDAEDFAAMFESGSDGSASDTPDTSPQSPSSDTPPKRTPPSPSVPPAPVPA